ncbi:hypothetical protein BLOT_016826 [Blomia tropicalis]|nr:hypothetical protein BLOT_016826 [Blomia tropicalis]
MVPRKVSDIYSGKLISDFSDIRNGRWHTQLAIFTMVFNLVIMMSKLMARYVHCLGHMAVIKYVQNSITKNMMMMMVVGKGKY